MSKPFRFQIESADADVEAAVRVSRNILREFRIVRYGEALGGPLTIFRATTRAKAESWLQVYLTLSIEDRRKLREACAT